MTVALVFGPKVVRVLRGQGDQWDNRARVRGVTASFSLNGMGLVPEESPDLYLENEELKEEIQKLASQVEFMRIINMEMNNRHLKPKAGGYFNVFANNMQSPMSKGSISFKQSPWFHNHHHHQQQQHLQRPPQPATDQAHKLGEEIALTPTSLFSQSLPRHNLTNRCAPVLADPLPVTTTTATVVVSIPPPPTPPPPPPTPAITISDENDAQNNNSNSKDNVKTTTSPSIASCSVWQNSSLPQKQNNNNSTSSDLNGVV